MRAAQEVPRQASAARGRQRRRDYSVAPVGIGRCRLRAARAKNRQGERVRQPGQEGGRTALRRLIPSITDLKHIGRVMGMPVEHATVLVQFSAGPAAQHPSELGAAESWVLTGMQPVQQRAQRLRQALQRASLLRAGRASVNVPMAMNARNKLNHALQRQHDEQ